MRRYVLRKLLLALPLLWGVLTLTFLLVELAPGDAADRWFSPDTAPEVRERIVARYGLDRPMAWRYLLTLRSLATLDLGESIAHGRPVVDLIAEALPHTLVLSGTILCVVYPAGLLLGSLQALRRGTWTDTGLGVGSLLLWSVPSFWLALVLQLVFAWWWPVLPASGMYDAVRVDTMAWPERLADRAWHLVLPGVALGLAEAAGVGRYVRSALLETLRQDWVRTARAKGLRPARVFVRHALRNALLPLITLFGLSLPFLFSGSVLVETIFAWPGMGRLIVSSIFAQDTPVIVACFLVFALLVQAGNLLADVLVALADPRVGLD